MCSVKLVRVVCRLTSSWGSTLASSHIERCGAEGAKGDHTHRLGSRVCLLDSFIGSGLGDVVSVCLLRCSMQRMIAIIRIVVMSNPTDAMRSSKIMVCVCLSAPLFSLTSQFLGSSARNLRRLSCGANVKLLDGMPPRSSQWNFLLEN